jgi:hypothetical protein
MKPKVRKTAESLVEKLSKIECVETIAINEAAETEVFDPYFALILDVYYRGILPELDARKKLYGEAQAFETSAVQSKDRFLIDDIPVRIEYKSIEGIEELLKKRKDFIWLIKDIGTYPFYRIMKGSVMYERSAWIDGVRKDLAGLPDSFWRQLRSAFQAKMEHYLSDLGESVMQGDSFFYLVSASGFMKQACTVLFMINHKFEPSHRKFYTQIKELPVLPEEFLGRWESFLRPDKELPPERKFEVAKLIARSIIQLT